MCMESSAETVKSIHGSSSSALFLLHLPYTTHISNHINHRCDSRFSSSNVDLFIFGASSLEIVPLCSELSCFDSKGRSKLKSVFVQRFS